uniref:PABIR family member 3 n=1 Tax=Nannospalax galili TaxID=1026970 RepID=A0A8C6RG85_NANGA
MSSNEQEPDSLQNFQLSSGFVRDIQMPQEKMEVDSVLPQNSATLDCSFHRTPTTAPLINGLCDNSQGFQPDMLNIRRNSSAFMNQHGLSFLPPHIRTSANRLYQIKQEEGIDIATRESMHEREMLNAMKIRQSLKESLNVNDNNTVRPLTIRNIDRTPITPVASPTRKTGK